MATIETDRTVHVKPRINSNQEACLICGAHWRIGGATWAGDCPSCGKTSGYATKVVRGNKGDGKLRR
jgi:predicted RNA-binding Zn-ribbon protein involved in translation (DUF1610 family)